MTGFFRALTKRNWGWPYHWILADILATSMLALYCFLWASTQLGQLMGFVWLSVNAIGIVYEIHQIKKDKTAKEEFWEDIIANNLGIITACFKFWLILQVSR